MPAGKREAEATTVAATIAGGQGVKRHRTDEAVRMEVVEPPQVPPCFAWGGGLNQRLVEVPCPACFSGTNCCLGL